MDNLEVHSERLQRQAKEEVVELQEDLRQMTERASEAGLQEARASSEAHAASAGLARASERLVLLEAEAAAVREHTQQRMEAEQHAYQVEIDQLRRRITEHTHESSDKISKLTDDSSHLRTQLAEAESELSSVKIQMQQR